MKKRKRIKQLKGEIAVLRLELEFALRVARMVDDFTALTAQDFTRTYHVGSFGDAWEELERQAQAALMCVGERPDRPWQRKGGR
jgi:hypothetical protein